MKLHLELIRYGEDEMDWKKRGRIGLLIRMGARHLDVIADEDEMFDLDSVRTAIDVLRTPVARPTIPTITAEERDKLFPEKYEVFRCDPGDVMNLQLVKKAE